MFPQKLNLTVVSVEFFFIILMISFIKIPVLTRAAGPSSNLIFNKEMTEYEKTCSMDSGLFLTERGRFESGNFQ